MRVSGTALIILTCGIKGVRNSGPVVGFSEAKMLIARPAAEFKARAIVKRPHILGLKVTSSVARPSASSGSSAAKLRSHTGLRRHNGCSPYRSITTRMETAVGIHAITPTQSPKIASSLICRCPLTWGSGFETLCPEVTHDACQYKGCEWSTYPKLITTV